MIQWTPYAFVRLVAYLIAGILAAARFPPSTRPTTALLVLSLPAMLFVLLAFLRRRGGIGVDAGWAAIAAVFLLGYFSVPLRSDTLDPGHLVHDSSRVDHYTAVVASHPGRGANTWKQVAELRSVHTKDGWRPAGGKVLLYFDREAYDAPFGYGDILFVKGNPRCVPAPLNPNEFDYRRFLALRQIHHHQYVKANEVCRIGDDPPNRLLGVSIAARNNALATFTRFIPGEKERAVASALVLGDRDGLDDDAYESFSASGTMHVMAVSGLHVGVIYSMITLVLGRVKKIRGGKLCLAFLSMAVLWGYAFVTGLSPSVMRAAMMFSFVTLAGPWGRRANIYNTLAVSAFVLLLYDPNLIFSVGFQLSYAAVFGIVYFYQGLAGAWRPSSWAGRKIWEMSCVSVAAQLSTFPISLFYFNQFPVYFLLANLFAIPLAFAILVAGIFLVLVSAWSPVATVAGHALHYLVLALNQGVTAVASLPFGVVEGVYISPLQCWMLIGLMVAFIVMAAWRKFTVAYAAVVFALVFGFDPWVRETAAQKRRLVVYHLRGHHGFELTDGDRSYFFADSSLAADPDMMGYHVDGHRRASGVRTVTGGAGKSFVREMDGARLICWREYTIIHIFGREFKWPPELTVDCAIVSNNAVRELRRGGGLPVSRLIVDGSNSDFVARTLEREASEHAVVFHATGRSGAYIIEM